MSILPSWWLIAGAAAVSAVLAGAAGWQARAVVAERDVSALQAKHTQAVADAVELALEAEREARAEEARRTHRLQEVADATRIELDALEVRRVAAVARTDSLRDAARAATDALAAEVARDSTPAERSQAIAGTGLVFADVLGSCRSRLIAVAAVADEARIRGASCERAYDALKPTKEQP